MTARTRRFRIIFDQTGGGGRRISFRVRWPRRPFQINLTLTRYVPHRKDGVS